MAERIEHRERRLVTRLLHYCRSVADDEGNVRLDDIDPVEMADFKSSCFILDISDSSSNPKFQTVGSEFERMCGHDFTGETYADAPQDCLLFHAAGYVSRVLGKPVPLSLGGQFRQDDGRVMLYRSILIPLRDADGKITHMIGAANCREMAIT